ncbi:MAG: hypothetical protein EPN37_09640 [Chitinophagaceae bacterium]|nr:MAG: hypothetical protein EPN37_09640 [Chitinophagaceae bacterium]
MNQSFDDICPMRKMIQAVWISILIVYFVPAYAQHHKKAVPRKTESAKKADTVFTATLGDVPSGQLLPASFAKSLLDKPLIVRDQEHQSFPVISFSFGYQAYGTYVNDTTGLPEKTSTYISFPFNSDRLDSLWRTRIGNELKTGDQLYFDHIIAEDKNGSYHLSSPLHFTIK